ncbi:MAG: DUF6775 family putative metallopeptidase [Nitrososphaeraceae archaeon]
MKIAYIHLYGSKLITKKRSNVLKKELERVFPKVLIDVRKSISISLPDDYPEICRTIDRTSTPYTNGFQNKSFNNNDSFQGKDKCLILLDGFELQRIYSDFICEDEMELGHVHVIFKDSLISTYDEITRRFHARTLICGTPSIISTTGIIEAPAKPREYYFKILLSDLLSLSNEEIKTKFNGRFIDYGDLSVFCAALGFAVQAVFYFLTDGDPFCIENTCTLYNSHWQEEMIRAQVKTPKFCEYHETLLSFNYQN